MCPSHNVYVVNLIDLFFYINKNWLDKYVKNICLFDKKWYQRNSFKKVWICPSWKISRVDDGGKL